MTPEIRDAREVKSQVVEFMMEYVFAGDFDHPRQAADSEGRYHYSDKKIMISCLPSGREGWFNCAVDVQVIRRTWLSRSVEQVLSTGLGVDLYSYRPGLWVEYVNKLKHQLQKERQLREVEQSARVQDNSFSPIDDRAIFGDDVGED
ncbi:MAG TPA: hypothetical protein VFV34_21015 [Blastocatellia bacterium]|nr:hypothetical protein [Blastocatellia bacterium]